MQKKDFKENTFGSRNEIIVARVYSNLVEIDTGLSTWSGSTPPLHTLERDRERERY